MKLPPARKPWLIAGFIFVVLLGCAAGGAFLITRAYQRDMQSLEAFIAAYQSYDQAVASASAATFTGDGSSPSTAGEEAGRADSALADLKTSASARISSLIKNEKEAMRLMQAIADLASIELGTLKAYRQAAGKDAEQSHLAQAFHDLSGERRAAYAHFLDLGR